VGERKITTLTTRTNLPTSSGTFGAITLTAGIWDVYINLQVYANGLTNPTNTQIATWLAPPVNAGPWGIEGLNLINTYALFNASTAVQMPFSQVIRVRSDGSNLYLIGANDAAVVTSTGTQVIQGNFNNVYPSGANNPQYTYSIIATRIA
jgi:hypothetical protein